LLEALIDPSARISPGYGIVTLKLEKGNTVSGTVQDENDQEVVLKVGDQPDTVIVKETIAERTNAPSSMPNMINFLTKREIRDLVSFLALLKDENM
jgi:putative heme-binding domain-containing protein